MRKLLSIVLFAAIGLSLAAQGKTLTAAADPYPPFVDFDLPSQGLSLEIARAALATQGYELKMTNLPWARATQEVTEGTTDILPDTWKTAEREKTLLFSDPYASNEVVFLKRKGDAFEFKNLDSLAGKMVGIVRGYNYGDAFSASTAFKREEANDILVNVNKLLGKRIDLTLEDKIVVSALLKKSNPKALEEIEFTKGALSTNPLYICVGIKNPRAKEIIAAFNKGLAAIKSSGKYAEIMKSYGIK